MKRLVSRAKVSIPKKLASFCGQMEFWAFDVSLKNPILNLEGLTIIGRLALELPTMSPIKIKYFQNNCKGTQSHSYREAIEQISQYRRGKRKRSKEQRKYRVLCGQVGPRLIMWPWQGFGP